eukprot:2804906-Rhodomonas_salina.5
MVAEIDAVVGAPQNNNARSQPHPPSRTWSLFSANRGLQREDIFCHLLIPDNLAKYLPLPRNKKYRPDMRVKGLISAGLSKAVTTQGRAVRASDEPVFPIEYENSNLETNMLADQLHSFSVFAVQNVGLAKGEEVFEFSFQASMVKTFIAAVLRGYIQPPQNFTLTHEESIGAYKPEKRFSFVFDANFRSILEKISTALQSLGQNSNDMRKSDHTVTVRLSNTNTDAGIERGFSSTLSKRIFGDTYALPQKFPENKNTLQFQSGARNSQVDKFHFPPHMLIRYPVLILVEYFISSLEIPRSFNYVSVNGYFRYVHEGHYEWLKEGVLCTAAVGYTTTFVDEVWRVISQIYSTNQQQAQSL